MMDKSFGYLSTSLSRWTLGYQNYLIGKYSVYFTT